MNFYYLLCFSFLDFTLFVGVIINSSITPSGAIDKGVILKADIFVFYWYYFFTITINKAFFIIALNFSKPVLKWFCFIINWLNNEFTFLVNITNI